MTKLVDGIYKASLTSLRNAVDVSATKVFADKKDQERLSARVMIEVEKTLSIVPPKLPDTHAEFIEIPILDKGYKATIDSVLEYLEATRGYRMSKIEANLFAAAWRKAHTSLDCLDLQWSGWSQVLNRLVDFMDERAGDGNPVFILMRSLEQWRDGIRKAGIEELTPSVAPFMHFHVDVLAGEDQSVTQVLKDAGHESTLTHLNNLGSNHDRNRFLLTMLSPVAARRVHTLLKIPAVQKITASKSRLDHTL